MIYESQLNIDALGLSVKMNLDFLIFTGKRFTSVSTVEISRPRSRSSTTLEWEFTVPPSTGISII